MKFILATLLAVIAVTYADDENIEQKVAGGLNYGVNKTANAVTHVREGAANVAEGVAEGVGQAASSVAHGAEKAVHGARQGVGEGVEGVGKWIKPEPTGPSRARRAA